jgi:carbon storage regulator
MKALSLCCLTHHLLTTLHKDIAMLVLARKVKEGVVIDNRIKVTIVSIVGNRVKIGVEAPKEVNVRREELNLLNTEGDVDEQSNSLSN